MVCNQSLVIQKRRYVILVEPIAIKLEGARKPKIVITIWTPPFWMNWGAMFFSRPYSIWSKTSRSNDCCFAFVFVNCIAVKLLFWLFVGYNFWFKFFRFFFLRKDKNKRQKKKCFLTITLNFSSQLCQIFPRIYPVWWPSICHLRLSDV